jgi:hypothetical protein
MKSVITIILIFILYFKAESQAVKFNKLIYHDYSVIDCSVLNLDTSYIVVGGTYHSNHRVPLLVDIDLFGGKKSTNFVFEQGYNIYEGFENACKIVNQSKYILATSQVKIDSDSNSIALFCFNNKLDIIWHYQYLIDTFFIGGYSCNKSKDSGFIVCGLRKDSLENGDFVLIKTDSNGLYQWHKTYGGNQSDGAFNVISTWDNGYLITGYSYSFGGAGDWYVIKTDSLGNVEWEETYGNPNLDEAPPPWINRNL